MLDPKPKNNFKKKNWEYLNQLLKAHFDSNDRDPRAVIDVRDYEMTEKEIVDEARSKGYTVTVKNEYITFK